MSTPDPIFWHRPHGQPCHGITPEVIADFERLSETVLRNPEGLRYTAPADVTLVTYHNYKKECLIESCYRAYGIEDFVVLGREVAQWDWGAKINLVLEYLESGACPTRYVLCTDADDVLMVRDPAVMLERFLACSCDLLFCNTFVDYPHDQHCRNFETVTYYTHPLHCRLSAGAYIAEKNALLRYLQELSEAYDKKASWTQAEGIFVDQLGWRYLHAREHPRIKVDHQSVIFRRYDVFRDVAE